MGKNTYAIPLAIFSLTPFAELLAEVGFLDVFVGNGVKQALYPF